MTEKVIIFDASTLITLSMNGLLGTLKELKEIFGGRFIIPLGVKKEIIDRPLTIKRFELEALRAKRLLDDGVLELSSVLGMNSAEVSKKAEEMMNKANNLFSGRGKPVHIMDVGESACFALGYLLKKKGIDAVLAIDERTARMLCEKPENLEELLEKKLHINITPKEKEYDFFKGFKVIRSSELVYIAYKKGLVKLKDGDTILDALLYAVKFKGCSISDEEIQEIKKIG